MLKLWANRTLKDPKPHFDKNSKIALRPDYSTKGYP